MCQDDERFWHHVDFFAVRDSGTIQLEVSYIQGFVLGQIAHAEGFRLFLKTFGAFLSRAIICFRMDQSGFAFEDDPSRNASRSSEDLKS